MTAVSTNISGSVKKMIRDTTRLLNRPNLPSDLRREHERKLAALKVTLADREQAESEREREGKYRMVRFFERKKALRRLASAQAKCDDAAVAEAQLDLAYILHFPKDRKYISLYPASATTSAEVLSERAAIRKEISEKLALLGAETMLSKVNEAKKTKMTLKGSDDEESGSEEDEDESGSEEEDSEEDGSDDSESGSDDSDDGSEEDDSEDGLSYDEDDSDDEDGNSNDEEDSDEDSEDDDEDSEDEDSEDEDGSDDDSDIDSEEEEESNSEEDAPATKKSRH